MNSKLTSLISTATLLFFSTAYAENQSCENVLKEPSVSWINKASDKQNGSTIAIVGAIMQYSNCVDKNTDKIYAKMLKNGNYPLMGAEGNFENFTNALDDFTKLALNTTETGHSWDNLQVAYVKLYQKEFKLLFYQYYIGRNNNPVLTRIEKTKRPGLLVAKVYFEKIIKQFTPEQQKALRRSFNHLLTVATTENGFKKIYIYNYAIYMLQPISAPSFADPPF